MRKAGTYIAQNSVLWRIFLVVFLIYVSVGIYFGRDFSLISGVNLVIHEAGHVLFMPFGLMMMTFGGTLLQLFVPSVFLGYFVRRKDYFASAFMLWWLGENLTNVSIYVADANAQVLPLLGNGGHDWYMLLSMWNLLAQDQLIADLLWHSGVMLILTGIMWALMYSHKSIKRKM